MPVKGCCFGCAANLLQLRIYPIIPLCREETRACNNSLQLTLERWIPFPLSSVKRPYLAYADLSSILLCNAWAATLCDERPIQHAREDGEGPASGSSRCGAWCTPYSSAVLQCLSHPGTVDQKTPKMSSSLWPRGCGKGKSQSIMSYTQDIRHLACSRGKWGNYELPHFNHQALLFILPPSTTACTSLKLPGFLYP